MATDATLAARMERIARRGGRELPEPNCAICQVPEQERAPIGEVFKGRYLRRTVVLLVAWAFLYPAIDSGFNSYQGVHIIGKGWSAHNLFLMIGSGRSAPAGPTGSGTRAAPRWRRSHDELAWPCLSAVRTVRRRLRWWLRWRTSASST